MDSTEELLTPGQNIKPVVTLDETKTLLKKLYGLECSSIVQLQGYDDINYKVTVCDGEGVQDYVFKVMNSLDSKNIPAVEAQNELLIHLRSKDIPCSRPIKNQKGHYFSVEQLGDSQNIVRLLEYLPGSILYQVSVGPSLLHEVGQLIAKLREAAKDFHHLGYENRRRVWMLRETPYISKFLYAIKDVNIQKIVKEVIQNFQQRVLPVAAELEKGLIHGDFNEQNLVVQKKFEEWHITGILDFGDAHLDCYLFDLAVGITYMMVVYKSVDAAGHVIAGYSTIRKPTQQELSLLKVCIAARLCQSVVIGAYSILQDPENAYILSTVPFAWELLLELWPLDEKMLLRRWSEIVKNYEHK